jgi:hypothetical protein
VARERPLPLEAPLKRAVAARPLRRDRDDGAGGKRGAHKRRGSRAAGAVLGYAPLNVRRVAEIMAGVAVARIEVEEIEPAHRLHRSARRAGRGQLGGDTLGVLTFALGVR